MKEQKDRFRELNKENRETFIIIVQYVELNCLLLHLNLIV